MTHSEKQTTEAPHPLYRWRKVEAPKPWFAKEIGDELCGFFVNRTVRNGTYGEYTAILVAVPNVGALYVTGTRIVQLIDASQVQPGQPVRIVWQGYKNLSGGKQMKMFDLYIGEEEPVPCAELPLIKASDD